MLPPVLDVQVTIDPDDHLLEDSVFVFKSPKAIDPEEYEVIFKIEWPSQPSYAKVSYGADHFSIIINRVDVRRSKSFEILVFTGDTMHGPDNYAPVKMIVNIKYVKQKRKEI